MPKPNLIVIAGCNGSGKSTFSRYQVKGVVPFDFDKKLLKNYEALQDSELRDKFARDTTIKEFKSSINGAFSSKKDFCYETNFDNHPIEWVSKAVDLGYNIELHFYCLKDIELAIERVKIRTSNKGHYIPDKTVEYKWREGYKNLNLHYDFFDHIYLLDNSNHLQEPRGLFSLTRSHNKKYDIEVYVDELPEYSERRFPDIYKMVSKHET